MNDNLKTYLQDKVLQTTIMLTKENHSTQLQNEHNQNDGWMGV